VRWPADEHRAVGDDGAVGDEGAFVEGAAVTQAGAGHEDRPVADLAQGSDAGADDGGAMTEDRALPDLDRLLRPAFSAISASFARWSSSGPCSVITRSIHRLDRSGSRWDSSASAPVSGHCLRSAYIRG
jgi:hypothetical protein